ncbi:MAG: CCA tRNA nucleotidyltransferase, mitochondrial [Pleopsidium flavum]|nr:MAG: CCA tRNA nucleotidyltransferase, mitochondrial [Pleopsidium flavum]
MDVGIEQDTKRRKLNPETTRRTSTLGAMLRSIELTPLESILQRVLLDVSASTDKKPELRFAGGWVRDKLRGEQSSDIDVAISSMTGLEFAHQMKDYLNQPGILSKYKLASDEDVIGKSSILGSINKIGANPEKSKHLETVTTKMLGLDIDLVNLRKETYTDDSRNPQMEFGSPEEDALRRDATVNALFYNLQTSAIEDFTTLGLHDLEHKIIRTPLQPYWTFKDDPLRVLRLIRFASRFGYEIDQKAEQAIGDDSIKAGLRAKVSRERIWKELGKMLQGPDPYRALCLIDRLGLYNTIFINPEQSDFDIANTDTWKRSYGGAHDLIECDSGTYTEADKPQAIVKGVLVRGAEEAYLTWLLAALVPWARFRSDPSSAPGKKVPLPVVVTIVREGLKADNKVLRIVQGAVANTSEISALKEAVAQGQVEGRKMNMGPPRDVLGMAVRRWGRDWRLHVMLALLLEIGNVQDTAVGRKRVFDGFAAFLSHLRDLHLLDAHALKPIVDGKQIGNALAAKDGPWLKSALDIVMAWQLRHPDHTRPGDAIAEVLRRKHELDIR